MLSCRSMKAPLIFVSVLMHRETNFAGGERGDNRGTKCPDPKRCWTESNSAFSFVRAFFVPRLRSAFLCRFHADGASASRARTRLHLSRNTIAPRREPRACVLRAYPVSARNRRPLHSPFTDRAVGNSVGSPPTSRMQKTECGLMRSAARRIGVERAAGAAGRCLARGPARPAGAFLGGRRRRVPPPQSNRWMRRAHERSAPRETPFRSCAIRAVCRHACRHRFQSLHPGDMAAAACMPCTSRENERWRGHAR